ncbi:MAG: Rab family GTPase [Promethearchaeota archaeon]
MSVKSTVLKILTVGDGGVGKTTLLHRYKKNEFLADTQMTLGVGFFVKRINIEGRILMLQLWDFGGQEQFRFMLKKYAMGARGAILMYDLTRFATLENIEEWVDICRKDNPGLPIILVGTKLDLESEFDSHDYPIEMMNEHDLFDHITTSSKTGENIQSVFEKIAKKIIQLENNKKI